MSIATKEDRDGDSAGREPRAPSALESLDVRRVLDVRTRRRTITGGQREALRVTRERGHLGVPRESSVEDVAEVLDCAPETAAERPQKPNRG